MERTALNGDGQISGLMVRPAAVTGRLPAVLVIHEKHGLNLYIADVVRRVVKAAIWPSRPMG